MLLAFVLSVRAQGQHVSSLDSDHIVSSSADSASLEVTLAAPLFPRIEDMEPRRTNRYL